MKKRYKNAESIKIMGNASKKVMGPVIDILLWNVYKCRKQGWQKDFIKLIHDKDLVLLQEAIFNSPFDGIFNKSCQHQWIMARSFTNVKTNIDNGIKTGSTVEAKKHVFLSSIYSEPITNTKKMLLATEYPLYQKEAKPEQSLLVVNAHIINFVSFEKFSAHLNQVFNVLEVHDGPILLAGDFNTWSNKRLSYFSERARGLLLKEVHIDRQPRINHFFKHLDHVYCRGLEVLDVQTHSNIHSSDHYPISLSLCLTI